MIQRIQSLYLLAAALCGGLTFAFPVVTYLRDGQLFIFRTTGLVTGEGATVTDVSLKVPFAMLIGALAVAYLGFILLYKDRRRQARLIGFLDLLSFGLFVYFFITDRSIQSYLGTGHDLVITYGASMVLPAAMALFGRLAVRAIHKDEALVRSADRLR